MRLLVLLALLIPLAAGAETIQFPGPDGVTLTAKFYPAQGEAIRPAIVALHGCYGPYPSRDFDWARRLAADGHTVLLPDSFGSRGLGHQCGLRMAQRTVTSTGLRRQDAVAALQWLAAQPGTPPGGLVLMGWSDGGSTVLNTGGTPNLLPPGLVRGMVAFYPACRRALHAANWAPAGLLLILMGEADDWTPIAPCQELVAKRSDGATLVSYPGAYHDFDAPNHPVSIRTGTANTPSGSAHTGTDEAARADAIKRVMAFVDSLPPTIWRPGPGVLQQTAPRETPQ